MKHPTSQQSKLCFVGAGAMAEAIVRGLIERKTYAPKQISILNHSNHQRLQQLQDTYAVQIGTTPEEKKQWLQQADIVILAMKPKDVVNGLPSLGTDLHDGQLLISVIAGISSEKLRTLLRRRLPIVRTMPNTSSTIGFGATGMSFSADVTEAQQQVAIAIFEAVGIVHVVEEEQLHLVTALSGSGPAYVYYVMEAMIDAAVAEGMSVDVAQNLAVQTVLGAAEMVKATQERPAALREKVTSPNGTTFAALEVFRAEDLKGTIQKAMQHALTRSQEIGKI